MHEGEEGGETVDQPDHRIWPSDCIVHQLSTVTARGTGEVG